MTIQTFDQQITHIHIEKVAEINKLPAGYLAYMIDNLPDDISSQLDIKSIGGTFYLGNTAQRYLVSHADRSAASMFDVYPDVDSDVDVVQEQATPKLPVTFSVQEDRSTGHWLLIRDDSGGQTKVGTFGSADAADAALDNQLNKGAPS